MQQTKIEQLKSALLREFGFGSATILRIFSDIFGAGDPKKCVNCGASLAEYAFTFDYFDAQLLMAMGREVLGTLRKGRPFAEANKVHVQTLPDLDYTSKSRTTQCAKLGLIAKYKDENSRQVGGTWLITKRGFAALRGEEVPGRVIVYRGAIQERPEATTTLKKATKEYRPNEWVEIAGYTALPTQ